MLRTICFALLLGVLAVSVQAQQPDAAKPAPAAKTVLDKVYTAAQATRGKAAYDENCARCHRDNLMGFSGPPLKTDLFMDRWREFNLGVLYKLIKTTMPVGNPGTLTEANYVDIVSYILQANEIPTGTQELTPAVIEESLLVNKDGPQPLPSSAQVELVGCLMQGDTAWVLTNSSEPTRTMNQWELSPKELADAKSRDLGDQLFRLQNINDITDFNAHDFMGHKMEVKGILVRQANGQRVNVTSIKSVNPECP